MKALPPCKIYPWGNVSWLAIFSYKFSYRDEYIDDNEQFTIKWNDKRLKIKWPITKPILSKRDNILAKNIASIGFSSQGHVTLAVDQNGQILRPLISWQDVRPQQEMEEIFRIISPEEYYSITGMPLIPILIVTKINWIRKHEPDVYALTDKFVQHQDIILKAFGAESFLTDLPSTSFYGAWDVSSANWDNSLLESFDLNPSQFGQPTPSGTQVGMITSVV